jgi:hypothetical protein
MDVIQIRFPTLAVKILNNLDDQSLIKYRKSNRDNWKFLDQERFHWIRILKKFNRYFETSRETWRKAISQTSAGIIKKLAIAVFTFFKTEFKSFIEIHFSLKGDQCPPFIPVLIAAYDGDLNFFQQMNEKSSELKQPQSKTKPIYTALLYAALGGHLEVYQLFYDSAKVKNPKLDEIGNTPLHFAASRNQIDICKSILENITAKTPKNNEGSTPLHYAAFCGHLDICTLIFDYVDERTPSDIDGNTPLHLATIYGHLDVCKLFFCKHKKHQT